MNNNPFMFFVIAESPTRTHPDRKSHFRGGIRVQEEGCRGQNGCQGRRLAFRRELQRGRLRTAASSSFEMPRKDDGKANWMSYYYIRVHFIFLNSKLYCLFDLGFGSEGPYYIPKTFGQKSLSE